MLHAITTYPLFYVVMGLLSQSLILWSVHFDRTSVCRIASFTMDTFLLIVDALSLLSIGTTSTHPHFQQQQKDGLVLLIDPPFRLRENNFQSTHIERRLS